MPDDFCAEPVSCGGWRPLGCAAIAIVTASSCVGARTFPAPLAGALDCTRAAEQIARVAKSCGDEDLSFIGTLVGDARIVALGESDHGDGSALRLKAKIAKYLITQRGFDVLDWESGTWDVDRMATQLREGVPAGDAATAGLFPNFAKNRDVRDLLSWTVSSEQKILLFGFDPQFSGADRGTAFASFLTNLADKYALGDESLRKALPEVLARIPKRQKFTSIAADIRASDRKTIEALAEALSARRREIAADLGDRETLLVERQLVNLLALYDWHAGVGADANPVIDWTVVRNNNVRDRAMAENLLWLAQVYAPKSKIIVWAATSHVVRGLPGVAPYVDGFSFEGYVSMGATLSDALGGDYKVIAITSARGVTGVPGSAPTALDAVGPDSLEGSLQQINASRTACGDIADSPFARCSFPASFLGHKAFAIRWGGAVDGYMFIPVMTASSE